METPHSARTVMRVPHVLPPMRVVIVHEERAPNEGAGPWWVTVEQLAASGRWFDATYQHAQPMPHFDPVKPFARQEDALLYARWLVEQVEDYAIRHGGYLG